MLTVKQNDYDTDIESILDKCVDNRIETARDLRSKLRSDYKSLLVAIAAQDGIDDFIELRDIGLIIYRLMSKKIELNEFFSAYEEALEDTDSVVNKAEKMIEEKWADYSIDYPKLALRSGVLDLIDDDNRERARSIRGI